MSSHSCWPSVIVIDNEPTPAGGVPGPLTNPYVPVLLVGSSAHGPLGEMSPVLTTVVDVAAEAATLPKLAHVAATNASDASRLIQLRAVRRTECARAPRERATD